MVNSDELTDFSNVCEKIDYQSPGFIGEFYDCIIDNFLMHSKEDENAFSDNTRFKDE